ncbi:acyltransferase family protein [Collinsella sp. AM23-17]|uniref:acyltransferase family protein n=1 Tax=Collinsella sp. AM23-17 TaxID=2292030 RepID=UPI000E4948EA|nr:acyltransferase family protein [Collinsella sp. AM23-17]RHG00560.1 acyltransferase [Collinsella sp. AM23-17]
MQNTPTGTAHAVPQRSQRIAALDGLRALAIAGVVLYHLRPSRLNGGFLGVTLFFTLSGYLATKSIMRATARDGFSYPRYICRRVTRLMPPILVTIALTAVATYIVAPSLLPKAQQDALPSALFLSNWFYIFRNVSYFAAAGLPSPLTHLWFCGVQMQFYLVWPVILMALCSKTRSRNTAIGVTVTFTLASAAAMALMFDPAADTSRVYYGTDARAAELLCGALAAIAAPRLREILSGNIPTPSAGKGISKVNVVSLAWLAAIIVGAFTLTGENPLLYRGGFLLLALLTGLLIICVQNTKCIVRRLLSVKPLVWLGQRSFSVYLVHYPLLILMNPATRTTRIAWWEQALQLVVILAVAEVFYRLVERPCSRKPAQQDSTAKTRVPSPAMALSALGAACVLALAFAPLDWTGIATARAEQLRPELAQNATSPKDNGAGGKSTESASNQDAQPNDAAQQKPKEGPIAEKIPKNLDWKSFTYDEATGTCDARVLMIGDSVTAGAQSGIQAALPNAYIDGVVSRQFYTFQGVYAQDSANYDPSVVICALGTNGLIRDPQQVQDVINAVGGKPIYFVTVRVPLELQDRNNQTIRDVCAQNDNAGVIDWNGASEGHSEYLVDDGTHLTQAGIDTYAALIRQAICGH